MARPTTGTPIGPSGPSEESLVTRIDKDLADQINHIIRLGLDLCGAYELALRSISSPVLPRELRLLRSSHKRYFDLLRGCVVSLGGKPAQSEDLRGLVERGRVLLGEFRGDEGILRAMATNEEAYRLALREAIDQPGMPEKAREILASALEQEEEHRIFFHDAVKRWP